LTAGELRDHALKSGPRNEKFYKALLAVSCNPRGRNDEIDPLRLGKWLGRNKDRIVNLAKPNEKPDQLKLSGSIDPGNKQMIWSLIDPSKEEKEAGT
jgi:hypothetical protein